MVPLLQEDSELAQGGIFGDSMFAKDFAGKIEQKNEEEDAYQKEMAIFDQYYNQAYENLYKLIAIRFDFLSLSLSINCVSWDTVYLINACVHHCRQQWDRYLVLMGHPGGSRIPPYLPEAVPPSSDGWARCLVSAQDKEQGTQAAPKKRKTIQ